MKEKEMSKHTPGNWYVDDIDVMSRIDENTIAHVAQVCHNYDDAHLLAASKDLLEALLAARNLIELAVPFEGDVSRQVDKAIAKATGGES